MLFGSECNSNSYSECDCVLRAGQGGGQQQNQRQSSVAVKDNWEGKEDFDYPRLSKLTTSSVSPPEDLVTCGALDYFDRAFERVTTKNERRLQRINRIFHTVTTTDDPIIRRVRDPLVVVYLFSVITFNWW